MRHSKIFEKVDRVIIIESNNGKELVENGSTIEYKRSYAALHGYNCRAIKNAETKLIQKNGVFYQKATIVKAMLVTDEFPEFLTGADIKQNCNGSWAIKTKL